MLGLFSIQTLVHLSSIKRKREIEGERSREANGGERERENGEKEKTCGPSNGNKTETHVN